MYLTAATTRYGRGGGPERLEALCVLPLNMGHGLVVERMLSVVLVLAQVFLVLWAWYLVLGCCAATRLVYR